MAASAGGEVGAIWASQASDRDDEVAGIVMTQASFASLRKRLFRD